MLENQGNREQGLGRTRPATGDFPRATATEKLARGLVGVSMYVGRIVASVAVVLSFLLLSAGCEQVVEKEKPSPRGAANTQPDFGSRKVADQTYTAGSAITSLQLPTASGGNNPLTYSLAPTVPGLEFTATARTLRGTPTATGTYSMTYRVVDNDGDAAKLTFTIAVSPEPESEPEQDPPVETPPVDPPVNPPVGPPVTPPVDPPVDPPVGPPASLPYVTISTDQSSVVEGATLMFTVRRRQVLDEELEVQVRIIAPGCENVVQEKDAEGNPCSICSRRKERTEMCVLAASVKPPPNLNTITLPVTISSGQTTATLMLGTIDDELGEDDSTVQAAVSYGSYTIGSPGDTTVLVTDNEPVASIRASASSVAEGASVAFTVALSKASAMAISVPVMWTETGSALAASPSASVTIAAGSTETAISHGTVEDVVDELNSVVTASLSGNNGYKVGSPNSASVTVNDDDELPDKVALSVVVDGLSATLQYEAIVDAENPITKYQRRWKKVADSAWSSLADISVDTRLVMSFQSAFSGHELHVEVRAVNAVGDGPWSDAVKFTPTE